MHGSRKTKCTELYTECSPKGWQLLGVQSALLMWKEAVSKQTFIEFCTFYIIHLYVVARCIRRYCNFTLEYTFTLTLNGARGGVVVEALRYKPEGRGFDSRWCHWIFSLT
jgi:hypothetical protein